MRRHLRLLLLLVCTGVAAGQTAPPKQITLENSQLRVVLSTQNGSLVSVHRKDGNDSYLGPAAQAGWFRVQLPLPYWEGHVAASKDVAVTIAKQTADSVEFQAAELTSKEGKYRVTSRLALRLEEDNLICSLSLRNDSKLTIDRIVFPIVDVPPAAGGQETVITPNGAPFYHLPLRYFFSQNDIHHTHNPFDSLDPWDARGWFATDPKLPIKGISYPMDLLTAWFTYISDKKGVGFDVRTKDFQFQKATIERRLQRDAVSRAANRQDYELAWNWYPLVRPGSTWQSAEVCIKFDQGDWHAIAKQHRDFLRPWITRPKPPKEFRQSIGWLSHGIQSFRDIPAFAKKGVEVGAPYFVVYGWSEISTGGMSYDAFPRRDMGGVDALKRSLEEARKLGAYPLAWFNGTVSTESNTGHQVMGDQWTALDRWGGQLIDGRWSLYEPFQVASVNNNVAWFEVDPSTDGKKYILDGMRRFVEDYGFAGNEMDQGHKNYLSHREHADGTGPELAFSKGYGDLYARAEEIVKKANPAAVILGENPSELMNQYVDSTWIFEGGPFNLPIFTTWRYAWPWTTVPTKAIATDFGHANQAFMMNAPLDIFDDLTKYPEYAEHLKKLYALKKATADFFYQGEFSDQEGFSLASSQKEIMAKSYREPTGKFTAIVVINSGAELREGTLRAEAASTGRNARHFYLDGRMEDEAARPELALKLGAYDVQILVFETGK